MAIFLLEVGTEELPVSFVVGAIKQWQEQIPKSLSDRQLTTSEIQVYGTPRRLAVTIAGLPLQQPDQVLTVKGPAIAAAYTNGDPTAAPTKALLGFARSKGVELADLHVEETEKGTFVFGTQKIAGRPSAEILTELASAWITGLEGKRLMRWGSGELKFPRPIRWLVALLDAEILPVKLENIAADRHSQGHRVLHADRVAIATAADYVATLQKAFVIVDGQARQRKILEQIAGLDELIGAKAEVTEALLEEVTYLVEYPTAVAGEFDREFLQLPAPVIKTEMVSHQRYFPLYSSSEPDRLLPYFLTISNGDPEKSPLIAAGNGRVIRARLADGKFFYEADRAVPLESFLPLLEKVTFQEQLGSVASKVTRIRELAVAVTEAIANLNISKTDRSDIDRAAQLCKADLVTQMVKEFPELQGIMGQYYAQSSGETEIVAQGILEHYQPRGAGDRLPQTLTGKIIAIADRLDTLVGIFGLGIVPTGSSDPFALRRSAAAIVQIAWDSDFALNLPQLLHAAIDIYRKNQLLVMSTEIVLENLYKWFKQRCETLLLDRAMGIDYDLVDALFGIDDADYAIAALTNLAQLRDRALFLQQTRQDTVLGEIYEVVNRASRLAVQGKLGSEVIDISSVVDLARLSQPSERALYEAIAALPQSPTYDQLIHSIRDIAPILATFFEDVMVMVTDPQVQCDRLNLLGVIRNYSRILADFAAIRSDKG
jgi:glycyl-tRNA synthetase beta chain